MLSRADLQRLANREKVALGVLEKDYVLTEVLKALESTGVLGELLVFKGGTALRKAYFQDWRYSEDLDFTVKHDMTIEELRTHLDNWYRTVRERTGILLSTDMLHKPDGYARVRIQFTGPLGYPGKIFMDLSFDEPLCLKPARRKVISHPFPDEDRHILAYQLEELLAEKIRSLRERGKSRDYYDVWRILKEHSGKIGAEVVRDVLSKKLTHKGLTVSAASEYFPADIRTVQRFWDEDLSHQVGELPALEEVMAELRNALSNYL